MSPERAAQVLGIDIDALPHEVTGAFAARARRTHPDVPGGDAAAFREAVEARNVLLHRGGSAAADAGRSPRESPAPDGYILFDDEAPTRSPVEPIDDLPPWVVVPRAPSPALVGVGTGLLLLAAFLTSYDVPLPWTIAEPITRWTVTIAAAIAFATTGRRGYLVLLLLGVVATLAITIAITTFGGLLGLFVTMPAIVAINAAGFARRRRRTLGPGPERGSTGA